MSGDYNLTPEQQKQLYKALFGKSEIIRTITPKKKIYGSRRAIRRVLKARKEQEQSK